MVVRRISNNELYHHGVKGQKWGVRRYQNPDGTLTPAGRKRYGAAGDKLKYEEFNRFQKKQENIASGLTVASLFGNQAIGTAVAIGFGLTTPIAGLAPFASIPLWVAQSVAINKIKNKKISDAKKLLPKKELARLEKVNKNADNIKQLQKRYNDTKDPQIRQQIRQQMEQNVRQNLLIQQQINQQTQIQNQINLQNMINRQTQLAVQQSIHAANMNMSLGMTGGMNPHMFG